MKIKCNRKSLPVQLFLFGLCVVILLCIAIVLIVVLTQKAGEHPFIKNLKQNIHIPHKSTACPWDEAVLWQRLWTIKIYPDLLYLNCAAHIFTYDFLSFSYPNQLSYLKFITTDLKMQQILVREGVGCVNFVHVAAILFFWNSLLYLEFLLLFLVYLWLKKMKLIENE